jgi:hypothetical protein
MTILKLKNISDNSIVEIISFNIDNANNILITEDGKINVISLSIFKNMTLGTFGSANQKASSATHEIYGE